MDRKTVELFKQFVAAVNELTGTPLVDPSTRQKVGQSDMIEIVLEQVADFSLNWVKGSAELKAEAGKLHGQFWPRIEAIKKEKVRRLDHMKRGDELPPGVLEMVKVYIATKR